MRAGKIQQVQEASIICERPDTTFVASFLGSPPMNLLRGRVRSLPEGTVFETEGTEFPLPPRDASACTGDVVVLGLRPETLRFAPSSGAGLQGTVILVEPRGPEAVVTFAHKGLHLKVVTASVDRLREGDAAALVLDPATIVFFDGGTGRRIPS
jgi:multiple sugar transport system ATP-binding protein